MANPQKEKGYTAIANLILEALARIEIPGEAMRILYVILRKTYGYHKKQDRISFTQFADATGIQKRNVIRAIKRLVDMKIIIKIDTEKGNVYGFQKNFEEWLEVSKETLGGVNSDTGGEGVSKQALGGVKTPQKEVSTLTPTKDNTKETIQKIGEADASKPTPKEQATKFFSDKTEQLRILTWLIEKGMPRGVAEQELKKFINYWSELTPSGKKQRWETEKVFELGRRLATWFGNYDKFAKSKSGFAGGRTAKI